jgi:hypothetical protein
LWNEWNWLASGVTLVSSVEIGLLGLGLPIGMAIGLTIGMSLDKSVE